MGFFYALFVISYLVIFYDKTLSVLVYYWIFLYLTKLTFINNYYIYLKIGNMKNNSNKHTFHIPVMGTGFTIDTPIKVAPSPTKNLDAQ